MRLFIILLILLIPLIIKAQVSVAPVIIHLDDSNPNGSILIRNNSTSTGTEVSFEMRFGYPKSDTAGNVIVYYPENASPSDPSAVSWVSFLPKKFYLEPQEEKNVRVVVKPPLNLKDGEYWGRPVVKSQLAYLEDSTAQHDAVNASITMKFETFLAFNFRKGKVLTGIEIGKLTGQILNNRLIVYADIKRMGNSAYLGNAILRVKNEANITKKEFKQDIAVYYDLYKKFDIDVSELPKGKYNVELEFNTERNDDGAVILQAPVVNKKIPVEIL